MRDNPCRRNQQHRTRHDRHPRDDPARRLAADPGRQRHPDAHHGRAPDHRPVPCRPINTATGLGIASISFALAVGQFMWGASQPVFGAVADKYGAGRVIVLGGVMLASAWPPRPSCPRSGA
jgi:hypothetical protein